jgi:cadmium resistance protein CadD (predicted permease)
MEVVSIIGVGVAAFIATNIDDMAVLIVFFAQALLPARQVTFGQYVGFSVLVAVSVAGSLVSLVVPLWVVGLMGLLPIGIGIKKLIDRENEEEEIEEARRDLKKDSIGAS